MASILVVDDEIGIRELLSEILADEGYSVRTASSAQLAREARAAERPDLVLLDIWMPDTDGITLLKEWVANGQLTMPVVMMSGHATIDSAVEAIRIGALDFLEKPIALQKLLVTVKRALATAEARTSHTLTLANLGRSSVVGDLKRRLQQLAQSSAWIMMRGEAGMMPEIYARALQLQGTPFVAAAGSLAEAPNEVMQRATGGIVFVDDLLALSRAQLRGLGIAVPRGERYNVRFVSYASGDPARLVSDGLVEVGVVARLSEAMLPIPPLRQHAEDVPDLAAILLLQLVESRTLPPRRFSTAALNALRNYDWPGNIEQLKRVVRSAGLAALDEEIDEKDVSQLLRQFGPGPAATPINVDLPLREARDAFERTYFERLLAEEQGSMSRVAERSGMERTHLYRKLKSLGLVLTRRDEAAK